MRPQAYLGQLREFAGITAPEEPLPVSRGIKAVLLLQDVSVSRFSYDNFTESDQLREMPPGLTRAILRYLLSDPISAWVNFQHLPARHARAIIIPSESIYI
jgi:hypothetical protein